jgi:superfamily II DNA helicase RecQ
VVRAGFYHGAMSPPDRMAVHSAFLRDEIHVVVATSALGMEG